MVIFCLSGKTIFMEFRVEEKQASMEPKESRQRLRDKKVCNLK